MQTDGMNGYNVYTKNGYYKCVAKGILWMDTEWILKWILWMNTKGIL